MPKSDVAIPNESILCRNLIGGKWEESRGESLPVHSPYTGTVIGQVPLSTKDEVDRTVAAAERAFQGWRNTPLKERTQNLFRLRDGMLTRLDELANSAATESGKTVGEARAGVLKGIEVLEFALSQQNLDKGGAMEVSRGVTCQYLREPLGIVCGITPFNFPAMVPLWMIPIAVTVGNCFIHKPSEKVPLTAQLLGELMIAAGYPEGVYSIINGTKDVVEALIDDERVKGVGFVGSTPVAQAVYKRTTGHGKRALALGGAKNHLILVPDADPTIATQGIVDSFTGCAGQRCMAASLMLAVGSKDEMDPMIAGIEDRASSIVLGENMGAIIDEASLARINRIIDGAEKDGATIVLDGRKTTPPDGFENGYCIGPTIIDNAKPDMECATEEIFGPVLTIVRLNNLGEAIALENKNNFGNATSVFTTSGAVAKRVSAESTNGMVGINIGVPVPREPFSFGGTKESKFGQGDITGESSLDFWSNLKKVTSKWSIQNDANWMS